MICEKCSKRLQPDWKFCPECSSEAVVNNNERLSSFGLKYLPEAFEQEPYRFGKAVAEDTYFYQVFMRYVLTIVSDIKQLVHFRAHLIHETNRIAGNKHNLRAGHILWCALSLASDRYFADNALLYDWSAKDEQRIVAGWYDLIAPAFIPGDANNQVEASLIREWVESFLALHKLETGPLPSCSLCTAKCQFQYEIGEITQDSKIKADFQNCVNRDPASVSQSASWFCALLAERLIAKRNLDLSYCLAIHLIKSLTVPVPATAPLSSDSQLILAHQVRTNLSAQQSDESCAVAVGAGESVRGQVLEIVVRQALAGVQWQQICAAPMQANNITIEEVEAEIQRRRLLS